MIKQIRDSIPVFDCIPGCSDCCGVVPWSPAEVEFLPEQIEVATKSLDELKARAGSKKCGLLKDDKCREYQHRPIMCRIYGTTEDLKCPHGQGPGKLLTILQAAEIMAEYKKCFN